MTMVGYTRISSTKDDLETQLEVLRKICSIIFTDKFDGRRPEYSALDECMCYLKQGDTLVVADRSRLGVNSQNVAELIVLLADRGVNFISIEDATETRACRPLSKTG